MTRIPAALLACGLLLSGCSDDAPGTESPAPSSDPSTRAESRPKPGELAYRGRTVSGEWEQGAVLGTEVEIGAADDHAEILYAARSADGTVYVATGLRAGSRILRTITALQPETVQEPDGVDLYGGNVLGERGPDERVADGSYLLLGSVPGDVAVRISGPGLAPRPVTRTSTAVLPGFTVFYDAGGWQPGWDQTRLAPLLVDAAGATVAVRTRSWTG